MRWLVPVMLLVGGCATTASVDRHANSGAPDALDAVILAGPRAGQLSASREWQRGSSGNRAVAVADNDELRDDFVRDLDRALPIDPAAPRRVRATLTLQATGFYEGLAAETT